MLEVFSARHMPGGRNEGRPGVSTDAMVASLPSVTLEEAFIPPVETPGRPSFLPPGIWRALKTSNTWRGPLDTLLPTSLAHPPFQNLPFPSLFPSCFLFVPLLAPILTPFCPVMGGQGWKLRFPRSTQFSFSVCTMTRALMASAPFKAPFRHRD